MSTLSRIGVILCMILCTACTTEVLVDKPSAGFSPPGQLMVAPPSLPRLDTSKPMPQAEFLEQVAQDTGQYREVANSLAQLQFWGRSQNGWNQAFDEIDQVVAQAATSAAGKTETPLSGPSASSP